MVLKVLPAEEADMYRAAVIENEAYTPLETNQILFPGPLPPNALELRSEELKEQAREPNVFCLKVADTDLEGEQMISFARWYVSPNKHLFVSLDRLPRDGGNMFLTNLARIIYDDTYRPKPKPQRESPPGANAEAFELLFGNLKRLSDRATGGKNRVCKLARRCVCCRDWEKPPTPPPSVS